MLPVRAGLSWEDGRRDRELRGGGAEGHSDGLMNVMFATNPPAPRDREAH